MPDFRTVGKKIKSTMACAGTDLGHPVRMSPGPQTRQVAVNNFYAFSDEARQSLPTQGSLPPPFPPWFVCYMVGLR